MEADDLPRISLGSLSKGADSSALFPKRDSHAKESALAGEPSPLGSIRHHHLLFLNQWREKGAVSLLIENGFERNFSFAFFSLILSFLFWTRFIHPAYHTPDLFELVLELILPGIALLLSGSALLLSRGVALHGSGERRFRVSVLAEQKSSNVNLPCVKLAQCSGAGPKSLRRNADSENQPGARVSPVFI